MMDVVEPPEQRDFVAEYTQAARQAGLRVGLYYSPLDWRYPGYAFPDLYRSSAEAMRSVRVSCQTMAL